MKIKVYYQFQKALMLLVMTVLPVGLLHGQDSLLLKQLEQSHYLKHIMKEDPGRAGLTRWAQKKVDRSRILQLAEDLDALKTEGPGTIEINHVPDKPAKNN